MWQRICLLVLLACLLIIQTAQGQEIHWRFSLERAGEGRAEFTAEAALAPGWHLYSQHQEEDGPLPTRFRFDDSELYTLTEPMTEHGEATTFFDEVFEVNVTWFETRVVFRQKLLTGAQQGTISGFVEYMVCNKFTCIPGRQTFDVALSRN